ncbi:MAG: hypothetical protein IKG25_04675 [Mogibacterium sp.]|nr:hypothetical protein [Mogibacterium sp.]MBR4091602.1 hypothetical protein [Mogibacterium sp.]
MKKRLVILIAATLLITSMPFFAFAEDEAPAAGSSQANVVREVEGRLYYFDGSGEPDMTNGWKTASNGIYYVSSGQIVTSPVWIEGSKTLTKKTKLYYNKKKKKWQTKKIKKAKTKYKITEYTVKTNDLYNFNSDGRLITTKGLYLHDGNEYYGLGEGAVKTGWAAIGDSAMYFDPSTGAMAKNTTVGYLKVPANGRLGKAYALGVKQLDKSGWTLKNAYKFSYKLKYQGRWYRAKNSETYAIKGFTKHKGNCYVMAATFYIQGKLLGYDIHQVHGKVGIWPHSWTVIKENGKEWVYDPNFRNETGRNGWRIYYGKKGTWKYSKKKKMN